MTTSFDPARATLRLDARALTALVLVAADPGNPSTGHPELRRELAGLEAAGLVVGGAVAPAVAELVDVLRRPQLRVVVEVVRAGVTVQHGVWATPGLAVVGRSVADDVVEYTVADPVSLPFALAALVGLGRAPARSPRGPLTVAVAAFDAAAALVQEGRLEDAAGVVRRSGAGEADAAAVVEVAAARQLWWRAGSRWMDGGGALHDRALAVVDAGPFGLWRADAAGAAGGGEAPPGLTLTPVSPENVWTGLVGLLPVSGPSPVGEEVGVG